MARLCDIFRSSEDNAYSNLKNRRVPIFVEDSIAMTMEMDGEYLTCDEMYLPSKSELEQFMKKFRLLSRKELEDALRVSNSEFIEVLNQMVPCVGCRRSAENLYQQVSEFGYSAFHPLTVDSRGTMSLPRDKMQNKFLCSLFHCPSAKMQNLMESLSKCKSGRRCTLHSLESQRIRTVSSWVDVWDFMDETCQEHVVLVDAKTLYDTLDRYLRKHRFCTECKSKVVRAYSILVGDVEPCVETGYTPQLYEGIECCKEDRHLHLLCKTEFVSRLIAKAVPELVGSRRERHAKTMEIAQEEVLTCLGLCVFERLHRIQQRFREEERTWEIIMCMATQALRRSFEMAVEKKLGVSQLELLCEEISKEEQVKQQKKELKKQRRKRKKEKKTEDAQEEESLEDIIIEETHEEVPAEEVENDSYTCVPQKTCNEGKKKKKKGGKKGKNNTKDALTLCVNREKILSDQSTLCQSSRCSSETSRDCGYSSETNNDNASCSSPEGSEIGSCSESFCNHNYGDCSNHSRSIGDGIKNLNVFEHRDGQRLGPLSNPIPYRSLEEQLEASGSSEEDETGCIPEEELSAILTPSWGKQREMLREALRSQFNDMILRTSSFAQVVHDENSDRCHSELCPNEICPDCFEVDESEHHMCHDHEGSVSKVVTGKTSDETGISGKENIKKSQRPGGTNNGRSKQQQGQGSNRRYKGKNRR